MSLALVTALLFLWPLPDPHVERGFALPDAPWAAGHRGVDLGGSAGQRVRSAGAGRVSFAGEVAGRGVVSIELSGTGSPPLRTTYEPVVALVPAGEFVTAGQVVATLEPGPSHCGEERPCLHWGLRRAEHYLDPLRLLRPGRPVLLPVGTSRPVGTGAAAEPKTVDTSGAGGAGGSDRHGGLTPVGTTGRPSAGLFDLALVCLLASAAGWAGRRLVSRPQRPGRARRRAPSPPRPP